LSVTGWKPHFALVFCCMPPAWGRVARTSTCSCRSLQCLPHAPPTSGDAFLPRPAYARDEEEMQRENLYLAWLCCSGILALHAAAIAGSTAVSEKVLIICYELHWKFSAFSPPCMAPWPAHPRLVLLLHVSIHATIPPRVSQADHQEHATFLTCWPIVMCSEIGRLFCVQKLSTRLSALPQGYVMTVRDYFLLALWAVASGTCSSIKADA